MSNETNLQNYMIIMLYKRSQIFIILVKQLIFHFLLNNGLVRFNTFFGIRLTPEFTKTLDFIAEISRNL